MTPIFNREWITLCHNKFHPAGVRLYPRVLSKSRSCYCSLTALVLSHSNGVRFQTNLCTRWGDRSVILIFGCLSKYIHSCCCATCEEIFYVIPCYHYRNYRYISSESDYEVIAHSNVLVKRFILTDSFFLYHRNNNLGHLNLVGRLFNLGYPNLVGQHFNLGDADLVSRLFNLGHPLWYGQLFNLGHPNLMGRYFNLGHPNFMGRRLVCVRFVNLSISLYNAHLPVDCCRAISGRSRINAASGVSRPCPFEVGWRPDCERHGFAACVRPEAFSASPLYSTWLYHINSCNKIVNTEPWFGVLSVFHAR